MNQGFAVLRPEPGNTATMKRVQAQGLRAIPLPLFEIRPLDWAAPAPAEYDALLLTSANAVRFGGPGLEALRHLPVLAVGARTAEISRVAGFDVMAVGDFDATSLLASDHGFTRMLHLGGRDRSIGAGGAIARAIAIYTSEAVPIAAGQLDSLEGSVALLHSARAAARLGALIDGDGRARSSIAIAAFSPTIASAAGKGWAWTVTAAAPNDAALIDAARARLTG